MNSNLIQCMQIVTAVIHFQELSAISASNVKILLCGHYVNIVANTGVHEVNPCYKDWEFSSNVTIYGEYVESHSCLEFQIDEAFDYANQLLLRVLRDDQHDITHLIINLNHFYFLLRGDLSIYLYDYLNDYLNLPASRLDLVKIQSLFQEAVFSVFSPVSCSSSSKQFVESLRVEKKKGTDEEKGWDVIDVNLNLNYPLNIIVSNSILQKYKKLFHQLLMLNVQLGILY